MSTRPTYLAAVAALLLLVAPAPAHAYLGPSLGMGAIGVALGIFGSILLGIISVFWYPVKRLLRRLRAARPDRRPDAAESDSEERS